MEYKINKFIVNKLSVQKVTDISLLVIKIFFYFLNLLMFKSFKYINPFLRNFRLPAKTLFKNSFCNLFKIYEIMNYYIFNSFSALNCLINLDAIFV